MGAAGASTHMCERQSGALAPGKQHQPWAAPTCCACDGKAGPQGPNPLQVFPILQDFKLQGIMGVTLGIICRRRGRLESEPSLGPPVL